MKPLVEAFFAWINNHVKDVPSKSETGKGFTYCLNQEKYLKVFLTDGAKASAIICSIAETAKANNLKPYDYFEHLLSVIPEHLDDKNLDFLENLLPWSDNLPEHCQNSKSE